MFIWESVCLYKNQLDWLIDGWLMFSDKKIVCIFRMRTSSMLISKNYQNE